MDFVTCGQILRLSDRKDESKTVTDPGFHTRGDSGRRPIQLEGQFSSKHFQ